MVSVNAGSSKAKDVGQAAGSRIVQSDEAANWYQVVCPR